MRKQELPRCIDNGMAANFGQMMHFCDYVQVKSRELHESGSTQDLTLFFEDMHQFATLAEAIKGVYCSIPQARFIAQEKGAILRTARAFFKREKRPPVNSPSRDLRVHLLHQCLGARGEER